MDTYSVFSTEIFTEQVNKVKWLPYTNSYKIKNTILSDVSELWFAFIIFEIEIYSYILLPSCQKHNTAFLATLT